TGRPDAPTTPVQVAATVPLPSTDRVREYQERLRILDEQAAREAREAAMAPTTLPPMDTDEDAPREVDPLEEERRRKEYESLFASTVVLSRRPENQRPDSGQAAALSAAVPSRQ